MNMETNIVEILKDKPQGTKLYSSACGKCKLEEVYDKSFKISFYNSKFGFMNGGEGYLDKNGKLYDDGECVVFPSKEMRDWRKFNWKKGDVLISNDGKKEVFFNGFTDDTYALFKAKHGFEVLSNGNTIYIANEDGIATSDYTLEDKDVAQTYINTIEERLGGKLNRETLEIEKPAFEIGKLYVFNEQDEDGELTIIGKLIGKDESYDTLTFGNQYEIENEKFVTDQAFDLRISVHDELREATEGEAVTFQEACTLWEKSKEKKNKEQPCFKTFDKVLVRSRKKSNWIPALFVRDRGENYASRYTVLPIHSGIGADFVHCIPYEGNENIAFTDYDVENLPF